MSLVEPITVILAVRVVRVGDEATRLLALQLGHKISEVVSRAICNRIWYNHAELVHYPSHGACLDGKTLGSCDPEVGEHRIPPVLIDEEENLTEQTFGPVPTSGKTEVLPEPSKESHKKVHIIAVAVLCSNKSTVPANLASPFSVPRATKFPMVLNHLGIGFGNWD